MGTILVSLWALIKAGFGEKAGEWFFGQLKGLFSRRKKVRRLEDKVTIGALTQHVKDMNLVLKKQDKRITTQERTITQVRNKLSKCETSRAECRSDVFNLASRVKALEKKIAS